MSSEAAMACRKCGAIIDITGVEKGETVECPSCQTANTIADPGALKLRLPTGMIVTGVIWGLGLVATGIDKGGKAGMATVAVGILGLPIALIGYAAARRKAEAKAGREFPGNPGAIAYYLAISFLGLGVSNTMIGYMMKTSGMEEAARAAEPLINQGIGSIVVAVFCYVISSSALKAGKAKSTGKVDARTGKPTMTMPGKSCKHCGGELFYTKITIFHILVCLFFFPFGLLALAFPYRYCRSCDKRM